MSRFTDRVLKQFEGGHESIVVLEEKHGRRFFLVKSGEDFQKVCLKIVKQRHAEGCWYDEPEEPKKPAYTEEEAAALKGTAQEAAMNEIKQYNRDLREYEADKSNYDMIKKAADEGDGIAAVEVMYGRRDAEYEGFEIQKAESLE